MTWRPESLHGLLCIMAHYGSALSQMAPCSSDGGHLTGLPLLMLFPQLHARDRALSAAWQIDIDDPLAIIDPMAADRSDLGRRGPCFCQADDTGAAQVTALPVISPSCSLTTSFEKPSWKSCPAAPCAIPAMTCPHAWLKLRRAHVLPVGPAVWPSNAADDIPLLNCRFLINLTHAVRQVSRQTFSHQPLRP
ncbi:hypothetical protein MSKU3_0982 [Komagataeibacter oboediens]|nr:hypothetical protein MSKU3_0982 [Komagataeibacter oboediens]